MLPKWAVDLTVQVATLNERLGPHIESVEGTMRDHETRLRPLEQLPADVAALRVDHAALEVRVRARELDSAINSWLPRIAWLAVGAFVTSGVGVAIAVALNIPAP